MDVAIQWLIMVSGLLAVLMVGAVIADWLYLPSNKEDWLDD